MAPQKEPGGSCHINSLQREELCQSRATLSQCPLQPPPNITRPGGKWWFQDKEAKEHFARFPSRSTANEARIHLPVSSPIPDEDSEKQHEQAVHPSVLVLVLSAGLRASNRGGPRAAPHAPPTLGLEKGHVPIRKQRREREGQRYLTSRWQPARGPWAVCSLGRRTAPLCWSFPERFPVQDIAMQTPPPQPLPAPQPYLRAGGCCRAHEMLMLEMRPGQHLSLSPSPRPRVMGGGWGRRGLKLLLGESLTAVGAAVLGCHRFFSPHHIASFSSLLFPHKPKKMVSQQPPPATCFPHLLQHRAGPGGEALPWGSSLGTAMLQGCTLLLGAWLQGWCMNAEECVRAHA